MSDSLLDQIDVWKKKHDQNFALKRLGRHVINSAAGSQTHTRRNPKDVIPQIPDAIKQRFNQDDSASDISKRLSKSVTNKSNNENEIAQKSNFSKRKSSLVSDLDKIEEIHEKNESSYAKNFRSSSTSLSPSTKNNNNNSNRAFNDKSNQMEKSRRDNYDMKSSSNHSRILQNISSNNNNRQLNSTAITSSTQHKNNTNNNIPITPIPQFRERDNLIINSSDDDEEIEKADRNFENDYLKPKYSSTANNTQTIIESSKEPTLNKVKIKNTIFESKKSLDFTSSGLPDYKRKSKFSTQDIVNDMDEFQKTQNTKLSEYDNFDHQDTKNKSKSLTKTKTLTLKKNSESEDEADKNNSLAVKKTPNKVATSRKDRSKCESPLATKNKSFQKSQLSSNDSTNNSVSKDKDLNKSKLKEVIITAINETINKSNTIIEEQNNSDSPISKKTRSSISRAKLDLSIEKDLKKSNKGDESIAIVNKTHSKSDTITDEKKEINSSRKTKLSLSKVNLDLSKEKDEIMPINHINPDDSISIAEEPEPVKLEVSNKNKSELEEKDSKKSDKKLDSNSTNRSDRNSTNKSRDSNTTNKSSHLKNASNLEISSDSENLKKSEKIITKEPAHVPKFTKSSITIERLPKKNTAIESETNAKTKNDSKNIKNVDPLDDIISLDIQKKSNNKLINSDKKDISLNQTESELISTNENLYLKKSFVKSINSTTNSSNISTRSTSYTKKTITELKTPFLTNNKNVKKLPPVPNDFNITDDKSNKVNESEKVDDNLLQSNKQSNDNEYDQFAFSNIEPADMFSPSKTLEIQKEESKLKPSTSSSSLSNISQKSTKTVIVNKKNKKTENEILSDESDQEIEKDISIPSRNKKKYSTKETKKSKPLKPISNTPKQNELESPIKFSQRNNKNLNVRRKTIFQLSPLPEYDDDGPRRSKRIKLDAASVPVYEWEQITDYTGKKVFVQSIVAATKRTCRLADLWEDLESRRHKKYQKTSSRLQRPVDDLSSDEEQPKTKKSSKNKPTSSQKQRADDLSSDDDEEEQSVDEPKNNKKSSEEINNDNNEIEFDAYKSNQASQREPIHIKMNLNASNLTETSITFQTTIDQSFNESQESIIFEDDESSVQLKKHVYCFTKNLESVGFKECYPGVSLKAISESNGYIRIDPLSSTQTQIHKEGCEYILQKGNCFVSIGGQVSKLSTPDIFTIPDGIPYKIKNISETEKAFLYFRFFKNSN